MGVEFVGKKGHSSEGSRQLEHPGIVGTYSPHPPTPRRRSRGKCRVVCLGTRMPGLSKNLDVQVWETPKR